MATAVKKTISLPPDLATEADTLAKEEGKTLSAVIQDALRLAGQARMKKEFWEMQGYERQGNTDGERPRKISQGMRCSIYP